MTYTVISRATVAPDYRETAISALNEMKEVSLANGAKGVSIGMLMSGANVGKFIAIQSFDDMAGIESAYDALLEAPSSKKLNESGKFTIYGRGILKNLTKFGERGGETVKYMVLTIGTADAPELDTINKFAGVLTANGAISGRYGPFVIGDRADGKTYAFGASYPSLSAVQSAYDAAADDGIASDLYKLVSVQKRQIIRVFNFT
mgnify:CR=1 FL=1|tara:strand:+ start:220 stop:831 length:612 start_codon:yes stop_codon:yes gene_type:complete